MIDLTPFCAAVFHEDLSEPFGDDIYTYATNGHIIVRVAAVAGAKKEFPLKMKEAVGSIMFIPDYDGAWGPIPHYDPPKKRPCHHCKGTGKSTGCDDCDGAGIIEFSKGWHDYKVECKECRGEGMVPGGEKNCGTCDGSCEVYDDIHAGVKIGNVKLSMKLIDKINALPGAELYLPAPESGMVNFRFDGGVGIAMKMVE